MSELSPRDCDEFGVRTRAEFTFEELAELFSAGIEELFAIHEKAQSSGNEALMGAIGMAALINFATAAEAGDTATAQQYRRLVGEVFPSAKPDETL